MSKNHIKDNSERLYRFYVDFYYGDDEELKNLLYEDPEYDPNDWYDSNVYSNEVALNCTKKEFCDFAHNHQDEIRGIERHYGVLDIEDYADAIGYSSRKISSENAPVVWEKLVKMLKEANLLAQQPRQ